MEIDFSNSTKEDINNFYKVVSNNVKNYRLEKGFSQEKLALDIGIKSIAFYSNCENNKYDKHFNLEHQDLREYNISSHDFRFTSARDKFEDMLKNGISEKEAKLKVSQELNHKREAITDYYLKRTK